MLILVMKKEIHRPVKLPKEILSLSIDPGLTVKEIKYVLKNILA